MTIDDIRADVLDRMERGERAVRLGVLGAALMEMLLLLAAIKMMNWSDPLHRLILVLSVCGYTVVVLGLVALGGHVSRVAGRIVAVMEPGERL
jgi:hypothetical protein